MQPERRKKLILPTHVDWGGDQGMICANCLHIKPRENPQPARYDWAFIPSSSLVAAGSWGFLPPAMLDFCQRDGKETRTDSSCPWYEQRTLAAIKRKIKAGKGILRRIPVSSCPWYEQRTLAAIKRKIKAGKSAKRRRKRLKKAEAVSGHQKIPTVDAAPLLTTPDTILGGA